MFRIVTYAVFPLVFGPPDPRDANHVSQRPYAKRGGTVGPWHCTLMKEYLGLGLSGRDKRVSTVSLQKNVPGVIRQLFDGTSPGRHPSTGGTVSSPQKPAPRSKMERMDYRYQSLACPCMSHSHKRDFATRIFAAQVADTRGFHAYSLCGSVFRNLHSQV